MSWPFATLSLQTLPKSTQGSWRSIAFVSTRSGSSYTPKYRLYAERDNYVLLEFDMAVNEKIYGLIEHFTPFVKYGQSIDISNEDGGTSSV